MARFFYFRTINLISRSRKLKFTCEIAIFFVLLALISSIISIYYEGKLAKHSNELINLEIKEHTIQEWLTDAPERNLHNKLNKFYFRLIEDNEKFDLNKKRYYFYLLAWYPETIKFAIEDMNSFDYKNLKDKYKLKKIEKDNEETFDFVYSIYKKFKSPEEWMTDSNTDKYFTDVEEKTLIDLLNKNEYNTFQINLFFQELNNIIDEQKKEISKEIRLIDKKSKEAILIAFIFQLLIFVIIQFMELREVRSAKKSNK